MPQCSRCGSWHPNPSCYVCAESDSARQAREDAEEADAAQYEEERKLGLLPEDDPEFVTEH